MYGLAFTGAPIMVYAIIGFTTVAAGFVAKRFGKNKK
jgi:hypothetical protein